VIGHLKDDHRMARNYLALASGDVINAVLAGAGYNFRSPHPVAETFAAPNRNRPWYRHSAQSSFENQFLHRRRIGRTRHKILHSAIQHSGVRPALSSCAILC
jgi:hypothetical protein